MTDPERLARLLGGPELQGLRMRLRGRYERGQPDGAITLGNLGDAEREALRGLLGRRTSGGASVRFELGVVDTVLRHAGLADSLRHALEILDGPMVDRHAEREQAVRQWEQVRATAHDTRLSALLASPRGLGLLKRLCGSDPQAALRLCGHAQLVLSRLPTKATTRSHLAAGLLGDAHALDTARPLSTLVLAVLRRGLSAADVEAEEESDRAVWAAAGVLVNELARPALFLNVATVDGALPSGGEPSYLSLRALVRAPPQWAVNGQTISVCENPNVVAVAADTLGPHCAPLVCTDGMPAAAQRLLLAQLRRAGASLRYHGDFDWPGIAIANAVIAQFGAEPWRFRTADYRDALEAKAPDRRLLGVNATAASWDADLMPAMRSGERAVDEEAVIDLLLSDLDATKEPLAKADWRLL
jgi:uncharacterized protein (TIGR02679 family)